MDLGDALTWNSVGTGVRIGGQIFTGIAQLQAGAQAAQAAAFTAAQLRQNAGQALAASQRDAYGAQKQTDYVLSRALAVAAASGGGASDPGVVNLMAEITAQGAYKQSVALYQGQEKARMMELQAQGAEFEGDSKEAAATGAAIGSGLGAASSLASGMARDASLLQRFGGGGPKAGFGEVD